MKTTSQTTAKRPITVGANGRKYLLRIGDFVRTPFEIVKIARIAKIDADATCHLVDGDYNSIGFAPANTLTKLL